MSVSNYAIVPSNSPGMNPAVWGPHFWFVLHLVSFHYPDPPNTFDKESFKAFYHAIKEILPCAKCRKHYKTYLSQYPIEPNLDKRIDLIRWVNQIHNFVNVKLGKPVLTDAEVFAIYANLDPISPFAKVDIKRIEHEKKRLHIQRLSIWLGVALLLVAAIMYIQYKYYYYLV